MKTIFVFVLFFCSVNSYSQVLSTDRLIGTWVWPDNNHPPKIIVQFTDSNHLRIRENGKFIVKDLTYKLVFTQYHFGVLKIDTKRSQNKKYDSCFADMNFSNELIMYGGFMDKPINEVLSQTRASGIEPSFIEEKTQYVAIYLSRKIRSN